MAAVEFRRQPRRRAWLPQVSGAALQLDCPADKISRAPYLLRLLYGGGTIVIPRTCDGR